MYDARSSDIAFARLEIDGNRYEEPLITILKSASLHKIEMQRALNHVAASQAAIPDLETAIDSGFKNLENIDAILGASLKFTPEMLSKSQEEAFQFSKIKAQWSEIKSKKDTLNITTSNNLHTSLIAGIRGMIAHDGNASNLILDPDLDSYYLIDTTLGGLPQLQDRIQEVTVAMEPAIHTRKLNQEIISQAAVYATLLQSDLDRITGDIKIAIIEDQNFYGIVPSFQQNIPPAIKELSEKVGSLIQDMKDIAAGKPVAADRFLQSTSDSLQSAYKSWFIATPEVTNILEARISSFKTQRSHYVLGGSLVLVIAGILSFFVARSLKNELTSSLGKVLKDLATASRITESTSAGLLNTSKKLSDSSIQQAASIQETVTAMNEINSMTQKSNDNIASSVEIVTHSQEAATLGQKTVRSLIDAIQDLSVSNDAILSQTEASNRQIEDIVRVINEIANKTKVINDIVFQTKLLSFNASVEAARAGEHGKGFAVVAEEVGNLAQMSGNAAKEIADMLDASTHRVESIILDTKTQVQQLVAQGRIKLDDGRRVASTCNDILVDIVTSIDRVVTMVHEVVSASEEQAKGVEQITIAMHRMDQSTHNTSQMSSDNNHHAEQLAEQAHTFRKIVKQVEYAVFGREQTDTASEQEKLEDAA